MSYHPRIESKTLVSFLTTRCRASALWFVNNRALENAVLSYAAKFSERYEVKLYALAIEGNHVQGPALFPQGNRAAYMRDLNASIARAVPRHTPEYEGGRFWARRYSSEFLPGDADVEEYFFYTVLQPIKDGLVERISDYPGYNCFHDAIHGIARKFKIIRWKEYHDAKRRGQHVAVKDFSDVVTLQYERLPGYDHLSQKEYSQLMLQKLEERRVAIVTERRARGLEFAGSDALRRKKRGTKPVKTKNSGRYSHRPRVLSVCPKRRRECITWYFEIHFQYREASRDYRGGKLEAIFPDGTYRPFLPVLNCPQR